MAKHDRGNKETAPKHQISGADSVTVRFKDLPPMQVHPESYLVLLAEKIQGGIQNEKE